MWVNQIDIKATRLDDSIVVDAIDIAIVQKLLHQNVSETIVINFAIVKSIKS